MWRRSHSLLLAATVLALAGTGPPVQAQRDLLVDHSDLLVDPEEEQPAQPQRAFVMTDEQFERWVFGRVGGAAGTRNRLEARLAWEIKRIDQSYRLTPEQKDKLE